MMATILIVEDDPLQRLWLEEELNDEGYSVLTAAGGREAMALVKHEPPDLVVLDIHMPDMDGLDVLNRLLDFNAKMPVILHTAYAAYRDSFMSWAADAYVVKSADTSELKQQIAAALQRRYSHAA